MIRYLKNLIKLAKYSWQTFNFLSCHYKTVNKETTRRMAVAWFSLTWYKTFQSRIRTFIEYNLQEKACKNSVLFPEWLNQKQITLINPESLRFSVERAPNSQKLLSRNGMAPGSVLRHRSAEALRRHKDTNLKTDSKKMYSVRLFLQRSAERDECSKQKHTYMGNMWYVGNKLLRWLMEAWYESRLQACDGRIIFQPIGFSSTKFVNKSPNCRRKRNKKIKDKNTQSGFCHNRNRNVFNHINH